MKKSIIFKIICFICIPILVSGVILSLFSVFVKNGSDYNESKYYSSYSFVVLYMQDLSNVCEDLIYRNGNYFNIKDEDKTIYFTNRQNYNINVKDLKYLIIYKNKALTNISSNSDMKTIDNIKEFIQNQQGYEKVNIVNGNIESSNDKVQKIGIQYLENLTKTYYTKSDEIVDDVIESNSEDREYITAKYSDFEIYSSYDAKFKETSKEIAVKNMLNNMPIISKNCYFIIPIGSIAIMLMIIYLVMSIGNDEKLNKIDKFPFEILGIFSFIVVLIPSIILSEYLYNTNNDYSAAISLIVTVALVIYVMMCICLTTFIRRIKEKKFWKTTIIGKIFYWFRDVVCKNLSYSIGITAKVIISALILFFSTLIILIIFNENIISVILLIALYVNVIYKIIKFLKDCSKIEKKLEEMTKGNNQEPLYADEFTSEFQDVVISINNISEGIENAVQERMKSEKLKAELITNVSHDIKTPLTSIINYVDLLKKEQINNEKAKEYIDILDNKSQRLKKLTEDLIEASKIQTGNVSLKKERINIIELIEQALGEFEDKFSKKGLNTIIESKQNEIYIYADSRYMYRIIENLFSNIAKYALENSRVYINIDVNEENVNIEIKNISKEKLNISADELMQRFVRGESSRTTEGSGLGISIAQNLTNLQGGKFDLFLDGDLFKVKMSFKII